MIREHLDEKNLHHAYLIQGERENTVSEILNFLEEIKINTINNPDFIFLKFDTFKIDDARNLKSYGKEKAFSGNKKIFIVSANSFLLEAQNSLLKIFEEPIENTHFFLVVPETKSLLKTFISRFYFISLSPKTVLGENKDAEEFIKMSTRNRIEFIKDLLTAEEDEDEEGNEIVVLNSNRSKALKFLNSLEFILHEKLMSKTVFDIDTNIFENIFKIREIARMPGSSLKTLLEVLALNVPKL